MKKAWINKACINKTGINKGTVILLLLLSMGLNGCLTRGEQEEQKETIQTAETQEESAEPESVLEEEEVPSKETVLAMREQVLNGMSDEEKERLTENIKIANLQMEHAYLYDDIFGKLEDPESLYWNYFDEKGEIQIGWAYDGGFQEMHKIMEEENLSQEEFYSKYGTPVTDYNRFDAENFIELMEEMKESVQHEGFLKDLQSLIDETALAAETHEMEHANNIYRLLHDMDYYLLRYGPEDVGKYTQDGSVVSKYYGVLSVYQ